MHIFRRNAGDVRLMILPHLSSSDIEVSTLRDARSSARVRQRDLVSGQSEGARCQEQPRVARQTAAGPRNRAATAYGYEWEHRVTATPARRHEMPLRGIRVHCSSPPAD